MKKMECLEPKQARACVWQREQERQKKTEESATQPLLPRLFPPLLVMDRPTACHFGGLASLARHYFWTPMASSASGGSRACFPLTYCASHREKKVSHGKC